MRRLLVTIGVWVILGTLFFLPRDTSFAIVTEYRSAQTITSDGDPPYTNLANCSATDGQTCDREEATSFGNLYFWDFGDFGIPEDSTINDVRLRVIGKSTTAPYVGVSAGREYSSNCQLPSTLWQMGSLLGSEISVFTFNSIVPSVGSLSCLSYENVKENNFIFRINWSGAQPWSANIDNFEIAFDYTPPAPPEPFLDLPWDYESKGMSFSTAATTIGSFFDHEYPLLSRTGALPEPANSMDLVTNYKGVRSTSLDYSSHDGYDYGGLATIRQGDFVLAAASGWATRHGNCAHNDTECSDLCGNEIRIDHENGFQTRYCHLEPFDLVVTDPEKRVFVDSRERIGRVGMTGNTTGPHIHFMTVFDKNDDENFEDNIPDGLVDPFGWQSKEQDPWENYTFDYLGLSRTGMKSTYLWITPLGSVEKNISAEGENIDVDNFNVNIPENANNGLPFDLEALISAILAPDTLFGILGPGLSLRAIDHLGNEIHTFSEPITIKIDFSEIDLSRYDPETITIYSSEDEINWVKETGTVIDLENKVASVEIDHFTVFALMAERIDISPPLTNIQFEGESFLPDVFTSDVNISLVATDSAGLGVYYTLYNLDNTGWKDYLEPISLSDEGNHVINYYSVDKDDNKEVELTKNFKVDKTTPEILVRFDSGAKDVVFLPNVATESAILSEEKINEENNSYKTTMILPSGKDLEMIVTYKEKGRRDTMNIEILKYGNDEGVQLDKNLYYVRYTEDKNGILKALLQVFEVKGEERVRLEYNVKKNTTKIIHKKPGEKRMVEEESGMLILQLYSDRGTLTYSY